jgi:hypothetical protein
MHETRNLHEIDVYVRSCEVHRKKAIFWRGVDPRGETEESCMPENIKSDVISRRKALSLLGLAGALVLALPTALIAEEAEAQEAPAAGAPAAGAPAAGAPAAETPATGTPGMQRRHNRRTHRHQRRQVRRGNVPAPGTTGTPQ